MHPRCEQRGILCGFSEKPEEMFDRVSVTNLNSTLPLFIYRFQALKREPLPQNKCPWVVLREIKGFLNTDSQ